MPGLFKRAPKLAAAAAGALGRDVLAQRMPGGATVPAGCTGVALDRSGLLARIAAGARLPATGDAFCFHAGPYTIEFAPFAAAPELGLQLSFVIDAPDPRVAQQRFDLYLVGEAAEVLTSAGFGALVESAVQRELAQGNLALPPCTSIDEWNAFRAGLDRLLYQRFGITIDDCIPVDLQGVDYALLLRERVGKPIVTAAPPQATPVAPCAATDALALRRLFLELPALTSALRQVALPAGQGWFQRHQRLLQRLDYVALSVDTMPALGLKGPGQPLDAPGRALRAQASVDAAAALDEAWSLVARLAASPAALLDDADRIAANLELHCATRRSAP